MICTGVAEDRCARLQVVHTQEDMPTLKQVAVDILPNS